MAFQEASSNQAGVDSFQQDFSNFSENILSRKVNHDQVEVELCFISESDLPKNEFYLHTEEFLPEFQSTTDFTTETFDVNYNSTSESNIAEDEGATNYSLTMFEIEQFQESSDELSEVESVSKCTKELLNIDEVHSCQLSAFNDVEVSESSSQTKNSRTDIKCTDVPSDRSVDTFQQTASSRLYEKSPDNEIENIEFFNSFQLVEKEDESDFGTVLKISDGSDIETFLYEFETIQDLQLRDTGEYCKTEKEDSVDDCNQKIEEAEKMLCEFQQMKYRKSSIKAISNRIPDEVDAAPTRLRFNSCSSSSLSNEEIQKNSIVTTNKNSGEKKVKKSKFKRFLRSKSISSMQRKTAKESKLSKKTSKLSGDKKLENTSVFY